MAHSSVQTGLNDPVGSLFAEVITASVGIKGCAVKLDCRGRGVKHKAQAVNFADAEWGFL